MGKLCKEKIASSDTSQLRLKAVRSRLVGYTTQGHIGIYTEGYGERKLELSS